MLYDKDIREPLFEFLDERFGKNRIIEEKQIGKSRADIMMVTEDALWGIEIKSNADTYARLERQVKDYNRFFDYNLVAVGAVHAHSVEEHVPDYWGIIVVDEKEDEKGQIKPDFYLLRHPERNPKREKKVLLRNQVSMLWRPELAHVQEINGMPKYNYLSKANVVLKIMEKVPVELLKKQLSDELFERDYSKIAETIENFKQDNPKRYTKNKKKRKK